jgi:hypothetical protein
MKNNYQIQEALQEVLNALYIDKIKFDNIEDFADEVYHYVANTNYHENGLIGDSRINRFNGKENLLKAIKQAIQQDNEAKDYIK